jgi:hypothetical protein
VSTVKSTYKFHKYADLYPLASEEELSRLTDDIKQNGLANPIVITFADGCERIVDGRNRYLACERAGVEPKCIDWWRARYPFGYSYAPGVKPYGRNEKYHGQEGFEDDLLMWVVAQNSHRRHLSQDQLKMVVAKVAESFKEIANQRKLATLKKGDARPDPVTATVAATGTAIQQAIKATGFKGSERSVADAVKVQKESPELAAKVSAGEMTVNAAKKELSPKPIPPSIAPEYIPETLEGEKALSDFLKNLQAITKILTPLTSILKKKEKFTLKTPEEHRLICYIREELCHIHSAAYFDSQSTFYRRAYQSLSIKGRKPFEPPYA